MLLAKLRNFSNRIVVSFLLIERVMAYCVWTGRVYVLCLLSLSLSLSLCCSKRPHQNTDAHREYRKHI